MSEEQPLVTWRDVYNKVELIDDKVNILLERDRRDAIISEDHEHRIRSLERWTYRTAVPLAILAALAISIDWVTRII